MIQGEMSSKLCVDEMFLYFGPFFKIIVHFLLLKQCFKCLELNRQVINHNWIKWRPQ